VTLLQAALLLVMLAAPAAAPRAGGWCSLVFKEVAQIADIVVLARYEKGRPGGEIVIVDVLKGEFPHAFLALQLDQLAIKDLRHRDHVLLALTRRHALVDGASGIGACSPVNAVAIHKGKLRGGDRESYDGRRATLRLDELARELRALSR
jgi:hypothetical protein